MGWLDAFRLWQPHSDEYLFVWNWVVAKHTLAQLAPATIEDVRRRYARLLTLNRIDPNHDIGFLVDMDYFWLSVTFADMGIAPMLGPKRAKWFYVQNHRRAWVMAGKYGDTVGPTVLKDICDQYGVKIDMEESAA